MVTSDEVQELGIGHNYTLCLKYYFREPKDLLLFAYCLSCSVSDEFSPF